MEEINYITKYNVSSSHHKGTSFFLSRFALKKTMSLEQYVNGGHFHAPLVSRNKKGFIGRVFLILVATFLILSYFNVDIKSIIESPSTQKNWSYVSAIGKTIWTGYLEKPTQYLWNNIFASFFKESFLQSLTNLKAIKDGKATDIKIFPIIPQGLVPILPTAQTQPQLRIFSSIPSSS
ncbi:MAG: hypothetical protein A2648_02405 [Candidatus Lloydbacteria bacterium RIFCSPHIGHO2_01_FULL_41_20]|uniref:Uncharacterized protein n=1 Tax=Candidatus Lloydbacteria bacterium RIFCSPHIGHO2_01_FULL_41_20 TaxID=1798657 RepID=A0A1G2CQX7_9BACT|nr:MAG: hypothetical protein A2648_02405 [Candidatus Lloydbacteria bacterium RIFCSPHIGHO2_01_FULL_41_20]